MCASLMFCCAQLCAGLVFCCAKCFVVQHNVLLCTMCRQLQAAYPMINLGQKLRADASENLVKLFDWLYILVKMMQAVTHKCINHHYVTFMVVLELYMYTKDIQI